MYHWRICFHTQNYNFQLNGMAVLFNKSIYRRGKMNTVTLSGQLYFKIMVLNSCYSQKKSAQFFTNSSYYLQVKFRRQCWILLWASATWIQKQTNATCLQMWIQQVWQITCDRRLCRRGPMRIFLLFLLQRWTWLHRRQILPGWRETRGPSHTASPEIINDIYNIMTVFTFFEI